MIGPPSGALTIGTAAATYVPTSPSIRIEILTACFMGSLLLRHSCPKNGAVVAWRGIIRHESSPSAKNPHSAKSIHQNWHELTRIAHLAICVNTGKSVVFLRCLTYRFRKDRERVEGGL